MSWRVPGEGTDKVRIALAQVNPTVGDLKGNAQLLIERTGQACAMGVDIVVFPELAIAGYPPEDLLLKDHFLAGCREALLNVAVACPDIVALVGVPLVDGGGVSQRGGCPGWGSDGRLLPETLAAQLRRVR